jgi:hypothetical protein
MSVIAEAPTRDLINILEKQYVLIYDTIKNGYNICPGGEGISSEMASKIFSRKDVKEKTSKRMKDLWKNEEYRNKRIKEMKESWTPDKRVFVSKKMKEAWTQERIDNQTKMVNTLWEDKEYIKKQSDAKKKHWANPEYRKKMCASSKRTSDPVFLKNLAINNWKDPDRAKRMSQGRKTGRVSVLCLETLKKYDCLMDAERDTGIDKNCLSLAIKGKTFRAGKLHWIKYENEITKEEANSKILFLETKRTEKLKYVWEKRKRNAGN